MRVRCQKEDIVRVLTAVGPIASSVKSTYVSASNVLIETVEGGIQIKSSNGDISVCAFIPAVIEAEGTLAIVHQKLFDFVKQLPDEEILIEKKEEKRTTIKTTSSLRKASATIVGIDAAEMSNVKSFDSNEKVVIVDKIYFKKMIKKTRFCVSMDDAKYTLNGVNFECSSELIRAVAIDGRRLAIIENTCPKHQHAPFQALLSQSLLDILETTIQSEGPLNFYYKDNAVFLKFDNFEIFSNVLQGNFPDYKVFLPKDNKFLFICDTKELNTAVNTVSVLTDRESKKLYCNLTKGKLTFSSSDLEGTDTEEEIKVLYDGEDKRFALNYSLLKEIAKEIESLDIEVSFNDVLAPFSIKEKGRNEYFYILTPMKVESF